MECVFYVYALINVNSYLFHRDIIIVIFIIIKMWMIIIIIITIITYREDPVSVQHGQNRYKFSCLC